MELGPWLNNPGELSMLTFFRVQNKTAFTIFVQPLTIFSVELHGEKLDGTWTNVGQTNVGQDKRGTDIRRTGQTWDRTNVGQGQT